jgi:hypothetical protein
MNYIRTGNTEVISQESFDNLPWSSVYAFEQSDLPVTHETKFQESDIPSGGYWYLEAIPQEVKTMELADITISVVTGDNSDEEPKIIEVEGGVEIGSIAYAEQASVTESPEEIPAPSEITTDAQPVISTEQEEINELQAEVAELKEEIAELKPVDNTTYVDGAPRV